MRSSVKTVSKVDVGTLFMIISTGRLFVRVFSERIMKLVQLKLIKSSNCQAHTEETGSFGAIHIGGSWPTGYRLSGNAAVEVVTRENLSKYGIPESWRKRAAQAISYTSSGAWPSERSAPPLEDLLPANEDVVLEGSSNREKKVTNPKVSLNNLETVYVPQTKPGMVAELGGYLYLRVTQEHMDWLTSIARVAACETSSGKPDWYRTYPYCAVCITRERFESMGFAKSCILRRVKSDEEVTKLWGSELLKRLNHLRSILKGAPTQAELHAAKVDERWMDWMKNGREKLEKKRDHAQACRRSAQVREETKDYRTRGDKQRENARSRFRKSFSSVRSQLRDQARGLGRMYEEGRKLGSPPEALNFLLELRNAIEQQLDVWEMYERREKCRVLAAKGKRSSGPTT